MRADDGASDRATFSRSAPGGSDGATFERSRSVAAAEREKGKWSRAESRAPSPRPFDGGLRSLGRASSPTKGSAVAPLCSRLSILAPKRKGSEESELGFRGSVAVAGFDPPRRARGLPICINGAEATGQRLPKRARAGEPLSWPRPRLRHGREPRARNTGWTGFAVGPKNSNELSHFLFSFSRKLFIS